MTFAVCEYAILFYAKCLCHAKFVQESARFLTCLCLHRRTKAYAHFLDPICTKCDCLYIHISKLRAIILKLFTCLPSLECNYEVDLYSRLRESRHKGTFWFPWDALLSWCQTNACFKCLWVSLGREMSIGPSRMCVWHIRRLSS